MAESSTDRRLIHLPTLGLTQAWGPCTAAGCTPLSHWGAQEKPSLGVAVHFIGRDLSCMTDREAPGPGSGAICRLHRGGRGACTHTRQSVRQSPPHNTGHRGHSTSQGHCPGHGTVDQTLASASRSVAPAPRRFVLQGTTSGVSVEKVPTVTSELGRQLTKTSFLQTQIHARVTSRLRPPWHCSESPTRLMQSSARATWTPRKYLVLSGDIYGVHAPGTPGSSGGTAEYPAMLRVVPQPIQFKVSLVFRAEVHTSVFIYIANTTNPYQCHIHGGTPTNPDRCVTHSRTPLTHTDIVTSQRKTTDPCRCVTYTANTTNPSVGHANSLHRHH